MSAIENRRLTETQVTKRCEESEVARIRGEIESDTKLFLGLGQDRFEHALALFVETEDLLHNMVAVDLVGAGAFDIIEGKLKRLLKDRVLPDPEDVCYVHNFEDPHRPLPVMLKKGLGRKFKNNVTRLLDELKRAVPLAIKKIARVPFDEAAVTRRLREVARLHGFAVDMFGMGQMIVGPLKSLISRIRGESAPETDEAAEPGVLHQLTDAQKEDLEQRSRALNQLLQAELQEAHHAAKEAFLATGAAERNAAKEAIEQVFKNSRWSESTLPRFRASLLEYAISSYDIFKEQEVRQNAPWETSNPFLPFEVKVFVDHSETEGVPIVAAQITTLGKAIGSIGHGRSLGPYGYAVDHRNLSPGFFHVANGGYLILSARDVASVPGLWQVLRSVIKTQEISVGENPFMVGYEILHPEPMNARLKVILFGPAWLTQLFSFVDDEFSRLFKIRGEILTKVERTPEQLRAYRSWLKAFSAQEGTQSLGDDAVCALIEHAQRLAGDQAHLSTDLASLATLVQEANVLVRNDNAPIRRPHIAKAIKNNVWRSNVPQQRRLEYIKSGSLLVSTDGKAVGQVNGLVVTGYDSIEKQIEAFSRSAPAPFNLLGDLVRELRNQYGGLYGAQASLAFGFPTRITARASPGKFSVVNIHKEAKLSGPSFDKADLIVQGILRAQYGNDAALLAFLMYCFEQTYGPVDGDSASLQKYGCLSSAIGKIPMRQDIATTGSLNLHCDIQPIGGVNEKSEGWYDVCLEKGPLTSNQGVIIPHQNVPNLMLREDVAQAIADRKFNIWAVKTPDEYVEIQSGKTAPDYHRDVKRGFEELAEITRKLYSEKEKLEPLPSLEE